MNAFRFRLLFFAQTGVERDGYETQRATTVRRAASTFVSRNKTVFALRYPGKPFLLVSAGEPPFGAFESVAARFISVIISA